MLRISLTSGTEIAALSESQLQDIVHEAFSTVHDLKRHLRGLTEVTRFRQRLLHDGRILHDRAVVELPLCLQLVMLNFREASEKECKQFASALRRDSVRTVDALLYVPLDPNMHLRHRLGNFCFSPLHSAAVAGSLRSARLLLEAGAEKDRFAIHGMTALHLASMRGHLEFVRWLVEVGAALLQDSFSRKPLYLACAHGRLQVGQMLFETGGRVEESRADGEGLLHAACYRDHVDILQWLARCGVDLNKQNKEQVTPLHIACARGCLEAVRFLTFAGARQDLKDGGKLAPLHRACVEGQLEVVRFLVETLESTEASKYNGRTPLYVASKAGQLGVVNFLLSAGSDVNRLTRRGKTPLLTACANGQQEVVECLLQAHADMGKAPGKKSPMAVARMAGHANLVVLLAREEMARPKRRRLTFKQPCQHFA